MSNKSSVSSSESFTYGDFVLNEFFFEISWKEHLDCRSYWSRKRENGLIVPGIFHRRSPSYQVAKTLKNELCKASKLYAHMQIKVPELSLPKKN